MLPPGNLGLPPVIPGLTKTEGLPPGPPTDPMTMLSVLMGRPQAPDTSTEKMARVVQLLREIAKQDPRIGMLASDALRMLITGPPTWQRPAQQLGPGSAGPGGSSAFIGTPGAPIA